MNLHGLKHIYRSGSREGNAGALRVPPTTSIGQVIFVCPRLQDTSRAYARADEFEKHPIHHTTNN
jgi:hypothetical protein